MPQYNLCGLTIASDFPLVDCVSARDNADADLSVVIDDTHTVTFSEAVWQPVGHENSDSIPLFYARDGLDYLLHFPDLGDFRLSLSDKRITCYPHITASLSSVPHIVLDQVLPLYLSMQDQLVLHAGTVASPKGAVAFLGPSGHGKSTLTASLCEWGWKLLADDCLLIKQKAEQYWAIPSYPAIRMWPDSLGDLSPPVTTLRPVSHDTDKQYLVLDGQGFGFQSCPAPLIQFYDLMPYEDDENSEFVTIQPLSAREAVMALLKSSFRLALTDPERISNEFHQVAHLATHVNVSRLHYPQKFALLPQVRESVLADLGENVPHRC